MKSWNRTGNFCSQLGVKVVSSNRIFNVNGRLDRGGDKLLRDAMDLALRLSDHKVVAWRSTKEHGLILDWCATDDLPSNKLPAPLDADGAMPFVLAWLKSDEAKAIKLDKWDVDYDHDGHNGPGWRVYCGDWGHVAGWQAIVAVKRVFMWYGK